MRIGRIFFSLRVPSVGIVFSRFVRVRHDSVHLNGNRDLRHHHCTASGRKSSPDMFEGNVERMGQTPLSPAADRDERELQDTLVSMCLDKPAGIVNSTGMNMNAPTTPGVWRRIGKETNSCWELYSFSLAETIFSAFSAGGSFVEWVDYTSQSRKRKRDADDDTSNSGSAAATHRVDFETMKQVELSTGIETDVSIIQAIISSINYTPTVEDPIETGVWWKDEFSKWHSYSEEAVHDIRKAWRRGEQYVILENIITSKCPQGVKYIVCLGKLEQLNPISGNTRPIMITSNVSMPQESPSPYARKNQVTFCSLGSSLLRGGLQRLMSLQFLHSLVAKMVLAPLEIRTIELNTHLKDDDMGQVLYQKFWNAYETIIKRVPGCCGQLDRVRTFTLEPDEESLSNHRAILRHVFCRAPSSELDNILKNGLHGCRHIKDLDFTFTTDYYELNHLSVESPTHALLLFLVFVPTSSKGSAAYLDAIPVAGVEHQLPIAVLTFTNPTHLELEFPAHESGQSGATDSSPIDCAAHNGSCLQVVCSTAARRESETITTADLATQRTFLPRNVHEEKMLLFKLYCPESERLRFVGGLVVPVGGRPAEILEWLRDIAGLAPDSQIRLYNEDSAKSIDQNSTYGESKLEDGNSVVYNNVLKGKERNSHRCPDWPTFREHSRNRQILRFRRLANPTVDEFCLEFTNQDTYSDVVEGVARHFRLEDGIRVRLTFNDCVFQQPKPLPLDGSFYSTLLANTYKQTTSILYFEILDCHPPELDGSKTLTVAFHDGKGEKLSVHDIELPKRSTVRDVITKLRGVVKELRNPADAEMRIFEVHCNRISRIHPANEKFGYLCSTHDRSSKSTLRAVEIPEEDRDMGPQDRLVHVRHFHSHGDSSRKCVFFGEPFLIVVREHEALAQVKERIKSKLQMLDKEILECKFALLTAGRREYLQGDDLVASRMQDFSLGFYDPVLYSLGLEHVDKSLKLLEDVGNATNSSKRLGQADGTYSLNEDAEDADGTKSPKVASKPRISPKSSSQGQPMSHDLKTSVPKTGTGPDPKTPKTGGDPSKDGPLQNPTPVSIQSEPGQSLTKSKTNSKSPQQGKEQISVLKEKLVLTLVENSNQGSSECVSPIPLPLAICCKPSLPHTSPEREVSHITVPDPEFHNFDSVRSEKHVVPGQVWAIYDNHDGMPRFYGLITQVCPSPFKVELSWLEPNKKKRWWVETTGVSITCGEFEKSMVSEIERNIGVFSHMVLEKAAPVKGKVEIYPKKGEVWAIFSNWDILHMLGPKPILTPNGVFNQYYEYDIVQMLDDYTAEDGVPAVKLVKTNGFKTIFHPQEGLHGITTYLSKDLRKFSHRIPHEKMDNHSLAIPREAVELDPASLPVEFTVAGMGSSLIRETHLG